MDNDEILTQWKIEHKENEKRINKLIKTIYAQKDKIKNFNYCEKGNENYLKEQIRVLQSSCSLYMDEVLNTLRA